MAEKTGKTLVVGGMTFTRVTESYDPNTDPRREDPFFTVSRSGYALSNVAAAALADMVAEKMGITEKEYCVVLGADSQTGTVSVEIVDSSTPGAQQIKRQTDGKTISIHLGGLFRQFRKLRPSTEKRACGARLSDEGEVLLISLKASKAKAKQREKSGADATKKTRRKRTSGEKAGSTPPGETPKAEAPTPETQPTPEAPPKTEAE